jgi:hypothetical protein
MSLKTERSDPLNQTLYRGIAKHDSAKLEKRIVNVEGLIRRIKIIRVIKRLNRFFGKLHLK